MGIEELILEQERKAAEKKGLLEGEKRGEKKGEKKGERKSKTEVVLASYDNGLAVPLISNITNLSENEVLKILKENGRL